MADARALHDELLVNELASLPAVIHGSRLDLLRCIWLSLFAFLLVDGASYPWLLAVAPHLSEEARTRIRGAVVSCAHDFAAVPAAIFLLLEVVHPAATSEGPLGFGPHSYVPLRWLDPVAALFIGFLLWDLIHYVMHSNVYKSELVSQLFHHFGFFTMLYINKHTLPINYAFPILYLGEISTFFLNIRLIYRSFGWNELFYSGWFAVTFTVTRVVLIGLLLIQIFVDRETLLVVMGPSLKVRTATWHSERTSARFAPPLAFTDGHADTRDP